ncbi:MAG: hypothetical protein ACOX5F_04980 [Anaerovoracaceae bacterium]|jgi:hypothetical protein
MREKVEVLQAISTLTDALCDGNDLKQILDMGYEILGNPIAIANNRYELVELSKHKSFNEPIWEEIEKSRYVPIKLRNTLKIIKNAHTMTPSETVITKNELMNHRATAMKLAGLDGKFLLFVLESEKTFAPIDQEILPALGAVVSNCLENSNTENEADVVFLWDLYKGNIFTQEALRERTSALGFRPNRPFRLINMHGNFGIGGFSGPLNLKENIQAMFPISSALKFDDRLLLLTDAKYVDNEDYKILEQLEKYLSTYQMLACISRPFLSLDEFLPQVEETTKILDAYVRTGANEPICMASDHYILGLLSPLPREKLMALCWPPILEILEHDRTIETSYLDSIYAYILCFGSISNGATLKGIHYDTMKKELEWVSAMVGQEWKQLSMQIYLSIKCLMLLTPELMKNCVRMEKLISGELN